MADRNTRGKLNFFQRRAIWRLVRRWERASVILSRKADEEHRKAGFSGEDEEGVTGTGDEGWRRQFELFQESMDLRHCAGELEGILKKLGIKEP